MPKRTRGPRRKHKVTASLTVHGLSKAGTSLSLEIYADDEKIGHLDIGRGSVNWTGARRQSTKRISWSRFATHMDDLAYGK
jgi:hypothetical protein